MVLPGYGVVGKLVGRFYFYAVFGATLLAFGFYNLMFHFWFCSWFVYLCFDASFFCEFEVCLVMWFCSYFSTFGCCVGLLTQVLVVWVLAELSLTVETLVC